MNALVTRRATSERLFDKLQGLFCVYKPADMPIGELTDQLKHIFVKGLNDRPCRETESIVKIEETSNEIYIGQNYADTTQALGARYLRKDIRLNYLHALDTNFSGVQICSINDNHDMLNRIRRMRLLSIYHIQGRLGVATDNFLPHGRVVEKSTHGHVSRFKLERLLCALQRTYQREMYTYLGIDMQSQDAYELAKSGLIRPKDTNTPPIVYYVKCIEFNKPYFTLELHTINERASFLKELIHDIGLRLKTNAICTQMKRIKDGFVGANNALPFVSWNFDEIYQNLKVVTRMAYHEEKLHSKTVVIGKTKEEHTKIFNGNNGET